MDILIIAYKFPPMGGIGTRRWAKFSKYLARKGYKVHILTINYPYIDKMNWYKDIADEKKIIIHRVKPCYPLALLKEYNSKYASFFKSVFNKFLKDTFFYLDYAQYWGKSMIPAAKKIIRDNNIKNIIATNPPASVSYLATFLKVELPYINLIQDFRDSWNDDIDYTYPDTIHFLKQKERSAFMELFVVVHSDYIVNVSNDITYRIRNKFKSFENKFLTIHNGFDCDDLHNLKNIHDNNCDKIKLIYAGELGYGRIKAVKLILDILLELPDKLTNNFEFNLYTSYRPERLDKKYVKLINRTVNFNPLIPSDKIFLKIAEHDYCLSINAPIYSYAFGTKVFDYMLLKKKIFHISPPGELSDVLYKKQQLVCDYDKLCIRNCLLKIMQKKDYQNSDIDYSEFNIEYLVEQFVRLFV